MRKTIPTKKLNIEIQQRLCGKVDDKAAMFQNSPMSTALQPSSKHRYTKFWISLGCLWSNTRLCRTCIYSAKLHLGGSVTKWLERGEINFIFMNNFIEIVSIKFSKYSYKYFKYWPLLIYTYIAGLKVIQNGAVYQRATRLGFMSPKFSFCVAWQIWHRNGETGSRLYTSSSFVRVTRSQLKIENCGSIFVSNEPWILFLVLWRQNITYEAQASLNMGLK